MPRVGRWCRRQNDWSRSVARPKLEVPRVSTYVDFDLLEIAERRMTDAPGGLTTSTHTTSHN